MHPRPRNGEASSSIGTHDVIAQAGKFASMSLEQALCTLWNEFTPGHARYRILVLGKPRALKPAIKEQIYLIGREAVLNALRQSGAAIIEIEVEYSRR